MTYSVLGINTQSGQRVQFPKPSRLQGLYIIGIPGTGKSGLIENLIIDDIKQGTGVAVLDPHGDLINAVLARMDRREQDVILLDITDYHYPFGINLFACSDLTNPIEVQKTVDQVMHVFEKMYGVSRDTPLILDYLRNCTYTLIANPSYTMAEIPLLLLNEKCRRKLVAKVDDIDVRHFWQQYEQMKPSEQNEQAAYIRRRVSEFLLPLSRPIVGQSASTIDMQTIMNEGKILFVKLSTQLPSVTTLIGSILIALILNAASARPANKRRQFHLYADEFQNFATEDFAKLLEEARKFGIGTTIAHQNRAQLETSDKQAEAKLRARTLSAANLVVFKVNSKDAAELAGEFDITPAPEQIEEREKEEIIGHRAVRTYKRDVIGHLLRQGHEDERVTVFRDDCLETLHLASLRKKGDLPKNNLGIRYDPEQIPEMLATLNTWLYAGMRDSDALWQPLPDATFGWLARFFGFEPVYSVWYEPQSLAEKEQRWQAFRATDFLAEEAQYSGIDRDRLVNAAITAIEASFADFLSSLFPACTPASIREGWRHSGLALPSFTFPQLKDRSRIAYSRITVTLLKETTHQPRLDAASYIPRFLAELSKPRNAVELFLPVLYVSYFDVSSYSTHLLYDGDHGYERDYREWRTVDEVIAVNTKVTPSEGTARPVKSLEHLYKYSLRMTPRYSYQLETFTDNIRLGLIKAMQTCLEPFLSSLRFLAQLHCAQLALSQSPIRTMESGEYEPEKRTQTHYLMHSQRSYADMLNEVASQLTNLSLYTARVRIMTEAGRAEHTIRTLDPKEQSDRPLFGQALQARLDSIKKQNIQDGYLRERAAVEAEIRTRQAQCSEPPEEEPPIYRR